MSDALLQNWQDAFWQTSQAYEASQRLRHAASTERLAIWTQELTTVVIGACSALGWKAAAKRNVLDYLPVPREEYLSLDVMAFAGNGKTWEFPIAVMELENSKSDVTVGYSLWKVLCVRAELRLVYCYRRNVDESTRLLEYLTAEVFQAFKTEDRAKIGGRTIVVVGSKSDAHRFPYDFFKWRELDHGTGKFGSVI